MTEEYDMAMLTALERLVARYGPRPVIRLAELIRDPKRAEDLAAALDCAAAAPPQRKAGSKTQRANRVGMPVLKDLRLSDPEKHAAVAEIRRQLLSHTILSSMDELRQFAMMNDLSIGRSFIKNRCHCPLLEVALPALNT